MPITTWTRARSDSFPRLEAIGGSQDGLRGAYSRILELQEAAMADQPRWQISGDYFENCSCDVVCPCLVSARPQLTSRPTRGACEVPMAFHIEKGSFGYVSLDSYVSLDGLNVALAIRTPGPMADGD